MAKKYTRTQWDALQASLPAEDRMTYAEYIGLLENFKAVEAASGKPVTVIVDEQTKAAGAKTDTAAQKTAATAAANTVSSFRAAEAADAKTDPAAPVSVSAVESQAQERAAVFKAAEDARIALEKAQAAGAEIEARRKLVEAAYEKYGRRESLTAEEKALLNLPANFEYPNVVLTTAGPGVVTTAGPGVVTTAGPNVVTTAGPGVVTTAGPNVVTTAGPGVVTTAGPGVVTTAGPGVVTTAGPGVVTTAGTAVTTAGPLLTTKAPGGFTYRATDGTPFTDQAAYVQYQQMLNDTSMAKKATDAASAAERQSAYDLLYAEFSKYGLGSLVEPLRGLIQSGASPAEFTIKLRESDAYKKRFSANPQRISKGLKAISEAEYIGLEDQYQNILRNAGLPESYWKRGDLGVQEGFTNFIANDVSAVELEDRVSTAQQRLIYANPEVSIALKTFYPDISNGDLLAYALDPTKGLEQIKRRITAAEIGSSAVQLGLTSNVTDAEYLARYGVNKAQAQQGYRTAAEILPTASKLGEIYSKQGLGPYTQQTAEQEIFNVPGAAEAAAKRRKLSELETAAFSGRAGMGALARDRAGAF